MDSISVKLASLVFLQNCRQINPISLSALRAEHFVYSENRT